MGNDWLTVITCEEAREIGYSGKNAIEYKTVGHHA